MCGIIGYVGDAKTEDAVDVLLTGLRTLEYRGYDSAGVFVAGTSGQLVKSVGDIANLERKIAAADALVGHSGIAHTRWATHGEPSETNAHPHVDQSGQIYVVHNGIIENYQSLKDGLTAQGVRCQSTTDTEVLAQLIGAHYQGDLAAAVQQVLQLVRGTYGLAVMHAGNPDELAVARLGSPIVIGVGEQAHYVASDSSALLPYTKRMVYLDDGDMATVNAAGYRVCTVAAGESRALTPQTIDTDVETVQKDGYDHFMLKEIMAGPQVVQDTLRGRLLADTAKLGGLEQVLPELASLRRLTIAACGTAYLAGATGRYWLEEYAGIPVELELASEYRYKTNWPDAQHALLAITQSGETADTLAAVREAKELGLLTLGVVNVVGSTIARETDAGVYNHAGPEIAVASTKAFISQLVVLSLITMLMGRDNGRLDAAAGKQLVAALQELPTHIAQTLQAAKQVQQLAKTYASSEHMMFIGRHAHAAIAAEGALKLKEVSYIHAEAYAAGELKHGPIALLDKDFPVFALAPEDAVYEKMLSNMEEVKARHAPLLVVTTQGATAAAQIADDVIEVPKVHPMLQPIISVLPLHLFAYYVGVERGYNVDRPRNLAKSVTVE